MAHLGQIANNVSGKPQLYVLKPGQAVPEKLDRWLNKVALSRNLLPGELIRQERLRIGGENR